MKILVLLACLLTTAGLCSAQAQYAQQTGYADPLTSLTTDVAKISTSVVALTRTFQSFVDKFEKVNGLTLTDKQQKLVIAMEILSRAEGRVAVLQKEQIDLTQALNDTRSKLAQNEIDSRPRSIDRSLSLEGTTDTQELRDIKSAKLAADRSALSGLFQQLQQSLIETNTSLYDAQSLANRLRRLYLPQIEKELLETPQQ